MAANRLGEEKISRLLWEFSLPATVGMLMNAIYNVVDRLIIGHTPGLRTVGLAAVTVAFPVMMVMMAVAIMIGVGGATRFSIHMGRKEPEEASRYLGNAVFLMLTSSVIVTVLGLAFLDPLLRLSGASDTVLPYAREYLSIVLCGMIFQTVSMGLNNFIRADGSPTISMLTMFIGAGFNAVFGVLFVIVFHWGLRGAAFAVVLGQLLSAAWCLHYFLKTSKIRLRLHNMKPELRRLRTIFTTGTPAFVLNVIGSILNIVLNGRLLVYGGDLAISAMGIINSLQTFMIMPVIGINQGVQPIISYNFGARQLRRVHKALKLGMLAATAITVFGWILTRLIPRHMAAVFTSEADLLQLSGYAVTAWFACLLVVGFQIISSNYFQAIGKPAISTTLTLLRQVVLLIPLIILLPRFFGLDGILWAAPIADFLSAAAAAGCLVSYLRKEKREFPEDFEKA